VVGNHSINSEVSHSLRKILLTLTLNYSSTKLLVHTYRPIGLYLDDCGNSSAYSIACVSVCVRLSVRNVGVLCLNSRTDRVGFQALYKCNSYYRGQLLGISGGAKTS